MSSDEVAIDVRNLSKRYEIYNTPRDRLKQLVLPHAQQAVMRVGVALGIARNRPAPNYFREFWALRDLSFQVRRGETLGVIGRNGCGKSTLLQILAGTLAQTGGEANVNGRVAALLELGSGFNPEFTGRENVFLNGRILGLTRHEIEHRYDQIVEFADIGEFINQPVKTYSSGMFVRLAFAVQAHIDASIVIIDEALAVGDVFFTQKCFSRLRELVDSGAAVILVTHDMATVTQFCDEVLVLNKGREMYRGDPVSAIRRYMALQRDFTNSPTQTARLTVELADNETSMANSIDLKWPSAEAFFDSGAADIVGTNQAEFIGIALCNAEGAPTRLFQIGEDADFFVEYRLLDDIDVPVGGVTIVNERGVLVHGKNSMQYLIKTPDKCRSGSILRFRHRVVLDIAPGEYTLVVGLATIDGAAYRQCEHMSHDQLSNLTRRILSIGNACAFTVTMCKEGMALGHHGLANLPGECEILIMGADGAGR